ncbi:E3 ubiquitin-protein ligase MARCH6 [Vairimorpha necatrix]|uniref:RING-type E3 ubiquitin transferase n=1 Tax=Vairimorpha necatrix TaxID=6039 RepID=A0AAX4JBB8_9MICR
MTKEETSCKICHGPETNEENLCCPCKCTGSIKFIHRSCLLKYIESSGKEFCTICKYKYEFRNIYKKDTPSRLPINLIIREIFQRFLKCLKYIFYTLMTLSIICTVVYINGSVFLKYICNIVSDTHLNICGVGIPITCLSFSFYYLYFKVSRVTRSTARRRNIRIDSMNVTSETISYEETPRLILSNIANERVIPFVSTTDEVIPPSNDLGDEMEENLQNLGDEVIFYVKIDFKLIPKICSPILFWWFFLKIAKYVHFDWPNCEFSKFLRRVCLYDFTKTVFVMYTLFLCLLLVSWKFKKIYDFFKILNLIFACFAIIIFVDGVCLHFLFSKICNNGVLVDFASAYSCVFSSCLFHIIIGYEFNSFFKKTIFSYTDKFRPGMLWSVAEPDEEPFDLLYKLSQRPLSVIFFKAIRNFIFHLVTYLVILTTVKSEINIKFRIFDIYKFLIFFRLKNHIFSSLKPFLEKMSFFNSEILKCLSRYFKMENFLFGEKILYDKNMEENIKWCPNKHKYYDSNKVRRNSKQKVTPLEIEKFFKTSHNNDFGLFYIPKFYQLYLGIFSLLIIFSTSLAFKLVLRFTKISTIFLLSNDLSFSPFADIIYIFIASLVFFIFTIPTNIKKFRSLHKKILIFFYVDVFWPLWFSCLIVILYGEKSINAFPYRSWTLISSTSDIVNFLFNNLIFTSSIQYISLLDVCKNLFAFTCTITFCVFTVKQYKYWMLMLYKHGISIPIFYLIPIAYIVIYHSNRIVEYFKRFLENIRRKNYLVDREIINYNR